MPDYDKNNPLAQRSWYYIKNPPLSEKGLWFGNQNIPQKITFAVKIIKMAEIGKYNRLSVLHSLDFGYYLDGGPEGEILLPSRLADKEYKPGDDVDVFVYFDSEDRIIATTEKPYATVGEFAYLKVVSVNTVGAFLDWGLTRDLLVPFREQREPMEEGKSYVVFLYIDLKSNRIAASSKLRQFLGKSPSGILEGDEVSLLISGQTEIGYRAVINNCQEGVLYKNEVFRTLHIGDKVAAYIKKIRDDGKIDLQLMKDGYQKIDSLTDMILEILRKKNGFISLTDKSPAEEIYALFGISKKTFKKVVGTLYRQREITLDDQGIHLVETTD